MHRTSKRRQRVGYNFQQILFYHSEKNKILDYDARDSALCAKAETFVRVFALTLNCDSCNKFAIFPLPHGDRQNDMSIFNFQTHLGADSNNTAEVQMGGIWVIFCAHTLAKYTRVGIDSNEV